MAVESGDSTGDNSRTGTLALHGNNGLNNMADDGFVSVVDVDPQDVLHPLPNFHWIIWI